MLSTLCEALRSGHRRLLMQTMLWIRQMNGNGCIEDTLDRMIPALGQLRPARKSEDNYGFALRSRSPGRVA
jgi:hypothetical protein